MRKIYHAIDRQLQAVVNLLPELPTSTKNKLEPVFPTVVLMLGILSGLYLLLSLWVAYSLNYALYSYTAASWSGAWLTILSTVIALLMVVLVPFLLLSAYPRLLHRKPRGWSLVLVAALIELLQSLISLETTEAILSLGMIYVLYQLRSRFEPRK